MHAEALGGGVAEFDAAVEARACPFLNQLGEVALDEMRTVYEQVDAGNYTALGELAERLAAAAEQKASFVNEPAAKERPPEPLERHTNTVFAEKSAEERQPSDEDRRGAVRGSFVEVPAAVLQRDAEKPPIAEHWIEAVGRGSPSEQASHDRPVVLDDARVAARRTIEPDVAASTRVVVKDAKLEVEGAPTIDVALPDNVRLGLLTRSALDVDEASLHVELSPQVDSLRHEQDVLPVSEATEKVMQVDVLEKEPIEIYTEFTEALHTLIVATEVVADRDTEELTALDKLEPVDEQRAAEEVRPMTEAVPVIASIVAERLAEVMPEEKEVIAPTLEQIVAAMQAVEALEEERAEPQQEEAAMVQLEMQIHILFEQLGIECEVEDIKRFAALLLRPDFQPSQLELIENVAVDLEHNGTHEAKKDLRKLVGSRVTDLEDTIERLLGKLVLLRSSVHDHGQPQLVAAQYY